MALVNQPVATILVKNIISNFALAKALSQSRLVYAVVKANAYGHGIEVAKHLAAADGFAVARVLEGVTLRALVSDRPIVVLGGCISPDEQALCEQHNLVPVVHAKHQLAWLKPDDSYWLKYNTGMSRLGFAAEDAQSLLSLGPTVVMSHFANADAPTNDINDAQWRTFQKLCEHYDETDKSIANSGAIMYLPHTHCDISRPGIMLYGGAPNGQPDDRLKPGMSVLAPVLAVRQVVAGEAIGYGSNWRAKKDCDVATVAFGYADGYPREVSEAASVVINGRREPIVGRVSMDMITVLLSEGHSVTPGTSVELWGENLPIDEVAAWANTISYTLMCGLGPRVRREWEV